MNKAKLKSYFAMAVISAVVTTALLKLQNNVDAYDDLVD